MMATSFIITCEDEAVCCAIDIDKSKTLFYVNKISIDSLLDGTITIYWVFFRSYEMMTHCFLFLFPIDAYTPYINIQSNCVYLQLLILICKRFFPFFYSLYDMK
jgi:hypothetical protein